MADDADRASLIQERMNDLALETFRRQHQMNHKRRTECVDCDEPIEPQRISLLAADRCMSCQCDHENKGKHYGNR